MKIIHKILNKFKLSWYQKYQLMDILKAIAIIVATIILALIIKVVTSYIDYSIMWSLKKKDYSSTLTGAFLMPPRGSNERFAH